MRSVLLSLIAALVLPLSLLAENQVKITKDIPFATFGDRTLKIDLHMPQGVENPPLVMFIHGGGWRNGSRKGCKIAWAARHGYAVASVEYRFSQQAIFPAQIHDCKGALRWLRAKQEKYRYDASRVVVAGSSAGGHLAALMATSGGVKALEGTTAGNLDQSSRVQASIPYYGPSDFLLRSRFQPSKTDHPNGGAYGLIGGPVQENLELANQASPVTHISKDDPPLLLLHGLKDKTVYPRQSQHLHELYLQGGLQSQLLLGPDSGHGWKGFWPDEKETILEFLKKHFPPGEGK